MRRLFTLFGLCVFALSSEVLAVELNPDFVAKRERLQALAEKDGHTLDNPEVLFALASVQLTGSAVANVSYASSPMGQMTFTGEHGQPADLSSYQGRPVALMFWGTWCHACSYEMESLSEARAALAEDDIAVVPIAVRDNLASLRRHYKRHPELEPVGFLHDEHGLSFVNAGLRGTPSHILLDSNHVAQMVITGPLDWTDPHVLDYLRNF